VLLFVLKKEHKYALCEGLSVSDQVLPSKPMDRAVLNSKRETGQELSDNSSFQAY
jgi:hypothetical protein